MFLSLLLAWSVLATSAWLLSVSQMRRNTEREFDLLRQRHRWLVHFRTPRKKRWLQ